MKNIKDCLKELADNYGWKYYYYDNGKLIQLVNRMGNSIAVYEHYFPLNSDTTARICDDRSLKCKLLNQANISSDDNLEIMFTSANRIIDDIMPILDKYKEIVVKSNFRRDKFIQRISSKEELVNFAESGHKFDKVLVNKFVNYEHFYSIYLVNGVAELVLEYVKPQIIGDGISAIWELLSRAKIMSFDDNIDLNKVLAKGEKLNTSWKIKASDSRIKIVNDFETVSKLAKIAVQASKVVGLSSGTVDIYEENRQYYVQSIDTSLNADVLFSVPEYSMIAKRLYEKALKILL